MKSNESKDANTVDFVKLTLQLKQAVDIANVELYADTPSWRLGASAIGEACKRALWYKFRWIKPAKFDARMLRLLNRGDREEARFIEWLTQIGCTVWAHDENGNQFSCAAHDGHFGGKVDAVIKLPEVFNFDYPLLASFKTNATGKGFSGLSNDGLAKHKPLHWAQECSYGFNMNLQYVAYFNINKNDDDLYIEIAKLDFETGKQMTEKAGIVIYSQTAPQKISDNPNSQHCKMCDFKGVCCEDEKAFTNCRSCAHASPAPNAEWYCNVHCDIIPRSFVESWLSGETACEYWRDITK